MIAEVVFFIDTLELIGLCVGGLILGVYCCILWSEWRRKGKK